QVTVALLLSRQGALLRLEERLSERNVVGGVSGAVVLPPALLCVRAPLQQVDELEDLLLDLGESQDLGHWSPSFTLNFTVAGSTWTPGTTSPSAEIALPPSTSSAFFTAARSTSCFTRTRSGAWDCAHGKNMSGLMSHAGCP